MPARGRQCSSIGTINIVLLITSSFIYSAGLAFVGSRQQRRLIQCCVVDPRRLGSLFLVLKFGLEWHIDIAKHLFPARPASRSRGRRRRGADCSGQFYFVSTGLHAPAHGRRDRPGRLDHRCGRDGRIHRACITRRSRWSDSTGASSTSIWIDPLSADLPHREGLMPPRLPLLLLAWLLLILLGAAQFGVSSLPLGPPSVLSPDARGGDDRDRRPRVHADKYRADDRAGLRGRRAVLADRSCSAWVAWTR